MSYVVEDPRSCPYCQRDCDQPHLEYREVLIAWRDGKDSVEVPWANKEPVRLHEKCPYLLGSIEEWAWRRGRTDGFAHMNMAESMTKEKPRRGEGEFWYGMGLIGLVLLAVAVCFLWGLATSP